MDKRNRGQHIEKAAREYLEDKGLTHVESNYHCRWGEIDIVMRDRSSLVFVEVRYRGSGSFTTGSASVDYHKQKKLCKTALHFLSHRAPANAVARFDVVAASTNNSGDIDYEWIANAFDCG